MGKLTKTLALYERNGEGTLIPQLVKLQLTDVDKVAYPELIGFEVAIIPITRGEIKEMFNFTGTSDDAVDDTDTDAELILTNCIEPSFTAEELTHAKPVIIRSIVKTILNESGVKINTSGEKKVDEDTDDFGKN